MGRLLKQFGLKIRIRKQEKEVVRKSYKIIKKYRKQVGKKCYKEKLRNGGFPKEVEQAQKEVTKDILKYLERSPFSIL